MSPLNHLADTNNWMASLPDVRGNQYLMLADALEDAVKNMRAIDALFLSAETGKWEKV